MIKRLYYPSPLRSKFPSNYIRSSMPIYGTRLPSWNQSVSSNAGTKSDICTFFSTTFVDSLSSFLTCIPMRIILSECRPMLTLSNLPANIQFRDQSWNATSCEDRHDNMQVRLLSGSVSSEPANCWCIILILHRNLYRSAYSSITCRIRMGLNRISNLMTWTSQSRAQELRELLPLSLAALKWRVAR